MKLGVLYVRKGQQTPPEWFQNGTNGDSLHPDFWLFMDAMGSKIDLATWTGYRGDMGQQGTTYYTKWEDSIDCMNRSLLRFWNFHEIFGYFTFFGENLKVWHSFRHIPRVCHDERWRPSEINRKRHCDSYIHGRYVNLFYFWIIWPDLEDEDFAFDPTGVGQLGTVPQVFALVQPWKGKWRYAISSKNAVFGVGVKIFRRFHFLRCSWTFANVHLRVG